MSGAFFSGIKNARRPKSAGINLIEQSGPADIRSGEMTVQVLNFRPQKKSAKE
jgi:hypothetical protein